MVKRQIRPYCNIIQQILVLPQSGGGSGFYCIYLHIFLIYLPYRPQKGVPIGPADSPDELWLRNELRLRQCLCHELWLTHCFDELEIVLA